MKRYGLLFFGVFFGLFCLTINICAQNPKISGGVLNGKATSLIKPDYPPAARAINAGGTVNVQITIDEQGDVISASAVSGHPLLKSASEEAAKLSKFSPTTLNGEPVKVTGILVYNFASGGVNSGISTSNNEAIEEAMNGQAVKLPSPEYPAAAKAVNAAGKVRVRVALDEKGNVVTANAVSGHSLLRASAEKAAKKAKFDSLEIKNKTVATDGVLIYVFFSLPKD